MGRNRGVSLYSNQLFSQPAMSVGQTSFVAVRPNFAVAKAMSGLASSMERVNNIRYQQQVSEAKQRYNFNEQTLKQDIYNADIKIKFLDNMAQKVNQFAEQALKIEDYNTETDLLAKTSEFNSRMLEASRNGQITPEQYDEEFKKFSEDLMKDANFYTPEGQVFKRRMTIDYLNTKNKITNNHIIYQHQQLIANANRYANSIANNTTVDSIGTDIEKVKDLAHTLQGQGALNPIDAEKFVEVSSKNIRNSALTHELDTDPQRLISILKSDNDFGLGKAETDRWIQSAKQVILKKQAEEIKIMREQQYNNYLDLSKGLDNESLSDLHNAFTSGSISAAQYKTLVGIKAMGEENNPVNFKNYIAIKEAIRNGQFSDASAFASNIDTAVNNGDLTHRQADILYRYYDQYETAQGRKISKTPTELAQDELKKMPHDIKDLYNNTRKSFNLEDTTNALGKIGLSVNTAMANYGQMAQDIETQGYTITQDDINNLKYWYSNYMEEHNYGMGDNPIEVNRKAKLYAYQKLALDKIDRREEPYVKTKLNELGLDMNDKTKETIYSGIRNIMLKNHIYDIETDSVDIPNIAILTVNGKKMVLSYKDKKFILEDNNGN